MLTIVLTMKTDRNLCIESKVVIIHPNKSYSVKFVSLTLFQFSHNHATDILGFFNILGY